MIDARYQREKYERLRSTASHEVADAVARDDYLLVLDALVDAQAEIAEWRDALVALAGAVERLRLAHGENCWDDAPADATEEYCGCGLYQLDVVKKRILRDFFGATSTAALASARSIPDPK